MKLFEMQNRNLVYPADNFKFWVNKWGISPKQLNDAIIETGSISVDEIKEHLIQKGVLSSLDRLFRDYLKFIK